ncbi:MAG TPA: tripartite tricarboxylate transporter substrate-binding protein [Burkholderiales bacterium]|nr:tripartite tricarboxylate transporter substrate-binding protein [Burkholderiales bacterium]
MSMLWKKMLAVLAVPALMSISGQSAAQASDYYKGKVLNVIVAGSPSGGHTRYARLIAPYLQKHLGAAEVRISNMPGGGGLKAANHMWRVKPDGYTVAFGNASTLIMAPIAGSKGVQFDATKFVFLGRATSEPRLLTVGGKSPIKTFQDVLKLGRPFVYPSQGTDEDFYTMAVLADALGFKLKAVTGYEGNADTALAVIKGDGDGHITGLSESLASIKSGDKRPVLVVTSERVPEYPDVPTAIELAPAAKKGALQAVANILETHRSYYAPPKTDPKAVAAFRAGLAAAMKDPALLEETKKGNRPVSFMAGDKQQEAIEQVAKEGASLATVFKAAVKEIQ